MVGRMWIFGETGKIQTIIRPTKDSIFWRSILAIRSEGTPDINE